MTPTKESRLKARRERSERATQCCAAFLKKSRIAAGLSQQQLAARLNQPKGFIGRIERGRKRLNVVDFMDVAEAIGKNASEAMRELLGDFPSMFDWCQEAEATK